FAGQKGRIGLISPLSHSFCSECNRVRVSATGFLRTCLACAHGVDLRPALVSGIGLQDTMQAAILAKPVCHHFGDAPCTDLASMAQIGG
nr:GTP 3',8-cyclase MoaA [Oscillospiraceae bacterium]